MINDPKDTKPFPYSEIVELDGVKVELHYIDKNTMISLARLPM